MKLAAGISYKEVKEAYDKEKEGRIKQRLLIILKAFKVKSSYKIAELTDTTHTKVQRWINRFNKYGLKGLKDRERTGKPSKLTKEQANLLDKELNKPKEFSVGWRTAEVLDKVKKMFGITYTIQHIRRLLYKLGYSRVKPRPEHINKDPIKAKSIVRKLKKNSYVWVKDGQHLQVTSLV